MIVDMWMTRNVVSIDPGESITTAANLMATRHVRRLPVVARCADGLHLLGIVTSNDLYRAYPAHVNPFSLTTSDTYQSEIAVSEVMKSHPLTTTPNAPIEEPARAMCDHKVGGIPVVEKGVLIGIITESDIFRAFVSMLESPRGSVRITFNTANSEDIFGFINRLAGSRKVRVISLISSQHHGTPVCVVRLVGGKLDEFLDDIWKSGYKVLNVLRVP
jgi:acetoin utilization protein AcuB